jgi:hypothetical protein
VSLQHWVYTRALKRKVNEKIAPVRVLKATNQPTTPSLHHFRALFIPFVALAGSAG